jgi:flagellar protein FliO/FliZ
MREMLEPIFGESGAVVAQFLITLAVVLLLIGLVYWIVRQFTGSRLHGAGRGRGPRLAVIEALSIDSRRKLVLVRRDHIEHLILIGGPSDLVVEPSIVRAAPAGSRPRQSQPQRPQPQQSIAASQPSTPLAQTHAQVPPASPQARNDETTGISEPIPFPPPRRAQMRQASPEGEAPPAEAAQREQIAADSMPHHRPQAATTMIATRAETASAHFEETARPTRIESVFSLANALDDIADRPPPEDNADEFEMSMGQDIASAEQPTDPVASFFAETDDDPDSPELSDEPAPALAIDESDPDSDDVPARSKGSTAKVSDLEEEMARLLGEITSKRDS